MADLLNLTNSIFETEVEKCEQLVVVKFGAAWCGPCKKLEPIVEEIAKGVSGVKFASVDIDTETEIPVKFGIMSVPTVLFFKGGKVMEMVVGLTTKEKLMGIIEKHK